MVAAGVADSASVVPWLPAQALPRLFLPEEKPQASLLCEGTTELFSCCGTFFTRTLRMRVKADTSWLAVLLPRTLVGHVIPILVLMMMRSSNPR